MNSYEDPAFSAERDLVAELDHVKARLAYVTQTLAPVVDDDSRPPEAMARAVVARLAAAEAVAAADGTLHSAIDHWQSRALAAEARLAEAERDSMALAELRRWLKNGATLKATDPAGPVVEFVNGRLIGGLTITFPDAPASPEGYFYWQSESPERDRAASSADEVQL